MIFYVEEEKGVGAESGLPYQKITLASGKREDGVSFGQVVDWFVETGREIDVSGLKSGDVVKPVFVAYGMRFRLKLRALEAPDKEFIDECFTE